MVSDAAWALSRDRLVQLAIDHVLAGLEAVGAVETLDELGRALLGAGAAAGVHVAIDFAKVAIEDQP